MKGKAITVTKVDGKIQHLTDVYPQIETNTILNKTITGIGATYSEIKAPRNSIIIEPSKPVIYSKIQSPKHKKDNLLGVVENVYTNEIINYIEDSIKRKKWIKILTTPESFKKVQSAFECLEIDIRTDGYFLLFDEIHKAVKDSGFRRFITLPMDLFFQCKDKAIVSATPPKKVRDQRFSEFQLIKLVSDFDYKKDIKICSTTNILQCTKEVLNTLNPDENPIFFFVNSISVIISMIKQLGIEGQSAVFCSSDSLGKIKNKDISKAYENWENNRIAKYNWMTSRCYSSLDIEINAAPNVVMLTDCYTADYTMIDPYMDAVQIVGRFRNGVGNIYHISNFNKQFPIKDRDGVKLEIKAMKEVYSYLKKMAKTASTEIQREAFRDTLSIVPYKKFLNDGNEIENPYKVDNYIDDEITKGLYNNPSKLLEAYEKCGFFNVSSVSFNYAFGDYERLKIEKGNASTKDQQKDIVTQLEQLKTRQTEDAVLHKCYLKSIDSFIVEAYDLIGKEEIERLNYSRRKIKAAMIIKEHQIKAHSTDTIELINTLFLEGKWYSSKYIKKTLIDVFKKMEIPMPETPSGETIKEFFDAIEKRTNKERGYYLIKSLFIKQ